MAMSPEAEVYARIRRIYDLNRGDNPDRKLIAIQEARGIGAEYLGSIGHVAGGKLIEILPQAVRQKQHLDQGLIEELREIEFPVPAELTSCALALQIAADGLETTLFAHFNSTPLVVAPNGSYLEAIDLYSQGRRLIQLNG